MTKRRRSTLTHFFRHGARPSADQFGDLIESTVNQIDDGFDKTAENGFEISSLGTYDSLISFFRASRPEKALWTIGYDQERDKLLFKKLDQTERARTVLSLSPDGKVGINRKDPECHLDVEGPVRSAGRIGVVPPVPLRGEKEKDKPAGPVVLADGQWHDITGPLEGCNALEVMAGVGVRGTGRHALLHAIAMNTYNPRGLFFNFLWRKNRIRCQHAYFSARGNKLQLRWAVWSDKDRTYGLQLRSRCDYGEGVYIRYYLTDLWFDKLMKGSVDAKLSGFPDLEKKGPPSSGVATDQSGATDA